MGKESKYVSKQPDENGIIHWTDEENAIWHDPGRASAKMHSRKRVTST